MRGMGQLVTTSFGQYPQFLPQTFGMGDYIVAKPGLYPAVSHAARDRRLLVSEDGQYTLNFSTAWAVVVAMAWAV